MKKRESEEYKHGFDAGYNGPNTTNCHFSLLSTTKKKDEWQLGYDAAKLILSRKRRKK